MSQPDLKAAPTSSDALLLATIKAIIEKHTIVLNTMKANRSFWEEEKWTEAQIQECDRMIVLLASILSDLNRAFSEHTPLSKDEAINILNNGADVSNFGEPMAWQKEQRTDRVFENANWSEMLKLKLNSILVGLEPKKFDKHPDSNFFMRDGEVWLEEDNKNKRLIIKYPDFWYVFESKYGMDYFEIRDFIGDELQKSLLIEGYTTEQSMPADVFGWHELERTIHIKPASIADSHKPITKEARLAGLLEGLTTIQSSKYPNSIFYMRGGQVWMEQDNKTESLYISHNHILSVLETEYSINPDDIDNSIGTLIGQQLKINGYIAITMTSLREEALEKQLTAN